jgi:outer membrane immunogenic protein
MKRIFLAIAAISAALLFAASRASAADLPVRPGPPAYYPVAAVYDWGGGYIGINGGYAFWPKRVERYLQSNGEYLER